MFKNKIFTIAVIVVGIVAILGLTKVKLSETASDSSDLATFAVKRGPLTISVIESGTIKAREQIIIKNEVEGRTSIIYLIPEGTVVTKGELLVQLDASSLEDNKIDQEIRVQNAEASYINATEKLAVVENQAKSDIELAELTLEFAKQDLKKYTEGEYPNELQKAQAQITLAEEELKRAEDKLEGSEKLYAKKYISKIEFQADQLAAKRKALDLETAKNNYELLTNFTYHRDLAQLKSDVSQAQMALERTNRKARADVVQSRAELNAREAEYRRQKDKLEKIEDQIVKTKIYAPADGLVIYATSAKSGGFRRNIEPLEEGKDVREREELIYLPTANSSKAEISIHESNIEKVSTSMPAIITVEALPGRKFSGTVAHIAPLPDAQSMWMNPDLKVYGTDIYLKDNHSDLRTGMSCQAEIIIEQYEDVLYVPVQSVLRVDGETTVYVVNGKTLEPRKVEIGLDNNRMVRIISGLKEGELVSLTPPLKSAAVELSTDVVTEKISVPRREETPSAEEESMRKRFRDMSDQDRETMRERFRNMTPEEREKAGLPRQRGGRKRGRAND